GVAVSRRPRSRRWGPWPPPRRSRTTRRRSARTRRRCAPNALARPRVVVYVTREHPQTGAAQLLVFDIAGEPESVSVVPGGRVEPGETFDQTAVRELREETGPEVRVVREVRGGETA